MMLRKRLVILSLAVIVLGLFSGCATAPLAPPVIKSDLPVAERIKIFNENKIDPTALTTGFLKVGNHWVYPESAHLGDYFERCGCFEAAAMMKQWEKQPPYLWALYGISLGLVFPAINNRNEKSGNILVGASILSFIGAGIYQIYGRTTLYGPSIVKFNSCLKKQLELE